MRHSSTQTVQLCAVEDIRDGDFEELLELKALLVIVNIFCSRSGAIVQTYVFV